LSPERGQRLIYLLLITKAIAPYADAKATGGQPRAATTPLQETSTAEPTVAVANASAPEAPTATTEEPEAEPAVSAPPPPASAGSQGAAQRSRLQSIPPVRGDLEPALQQRWQQIVTKGKLIENQTYFEMLGIPRDAKPPEIRTEFFKLAKEWHPDRLPAALAELKPYVETIFGYLSEAHSCLSDDEQRVKYVLTVREGGGTPATDRLMQTILDSAMQYERVLVLGRRHEYDQAIDLLQRILSVTKDEPDYHAMQAWLLLQKHPGKDAPLKEMLAYADRAIELHADHEKAQLYRALILRRMGRLKESLSAFKKVVAINPNNLEAAREVRVANMRNDNSIRPPGGNDDGGGKLGGMIGKLFKKK
jgi:tetratricopeptide (TPR) repeat protein